MLHKFFENKSILVPIEFSFKKYPEKKLTRIYKLSNSICGESSFVKIKKVKEYLLKNKINYLYASASENVNWLLNIRGKDLPNSPIANCKLIISQKGKLNLFVNLNKISDSIRRSFKNINFY